MKSSLVYTIALLGLMVAGSAQAMDHQFAWDIRDKFVKNNDLEGLKKVCAQKTSLIPSVAKEHSNYIVCSIDIAIQHNQVEMLQFLIETFGSYIQLEQRVCYIVEEGVTLKTLECFVKLLQKRHPESWRQHLTCGFMHYASTALKEPHAIQKLINAGADLNTQIWGGDTPLHKAVEQALHYPLTDNPYLPGIELLLKHGARKDIKNKDGKTVVELCEIKGKHKDTLRAIRDLIAPKQETRDISDVTQFPLPLVKLVTGYAYADDQELLDACEECAKDSRATRVQYLLESGCNPNAANSNGKRCLHYAAQCGNVQAVEFLLKSKADILMLDPKSSQSIPVCDEHGTTPLHHAAEQGSVEIVELLIHSTPDTYKPLVVNAQTTYSTVHSAHRRLRVHDSRKAGKRYRHEKGGVQYIEETAKTIPLMAAAGCGHPEVIELLLKRGADKNMCDAKGKKALHYAMESGITGDIQAQCIKLLS